MTRGSNIVTVSIELIFSVSYIVKKIHDEYRRDCPPDHLLCFITLNYAICFIC